MSFARTTPLLPSLFIGPVRQLSVCLTLCLLVFVGCSPALPGDQAGGQTTQLAPAAAPIDPVPAVTQEPVWERDQAAFLPPSPRLWRLAEADEVASARPLFGRLAAWPAGHVFQPRLAAASVRDSADGYGADGYGAAWLAAPDRVVVLRLPADVVIPPAGAVQLPADSAPSLAPGAVSPPAGSAPVVAPYAVIELLPQADGQPAGVLAWDWSADGRYLAISCGAEPEAAATDDVAAGYGLVVDLADGRGLRHALPGRPLLATVSLEGAVLWLYRALDQVPADLYFGLWLADSTGRGYSLSAEDAELAAGFAGAAWLLVADVAAGSGGQARYDLVLRHREGERLYFSRHSPLEPLEGLLDSAALSGLVFRPAAIAAMVTPAAVGGAGHAQEPVATVLPALTAEAVAAWPRWPVTDLVDPAVVATAPASASSASSMAAIRPPLDADGGLFWPGRRLRTLAIQPDGAGRWWLLVESTPVPNDPAPGASIAAPRSAPTAAAATGPAVPMVPGADLLLVLADASSAARAVWRLPLPLSRADQPDGPVFAFGDNHLYILSRAYDQFMYLQRLALPNWPLPDGMAAGAAVADWALRLPVAVDAAQPFYDLVALADGGCLIGQSAADAASGLKLIAVKADGSLRWTRYLERPSPLQGLRSLNRPQLAFVGNHVQLLWPPFRQTLESASQVAVPEALAGQAWFAVLNPADGQAGGWQLTLPRLDWQRSWPLAAGPGGFAFYESRLGRFVSLSRLEGSFRLRSFVLPAFVTVNQGSHDLQLSDVRRVAWQAGSGLALAWLSEPVAATETGGGAAAGTQPPADGASSAGTQAAWPFEGFLLWDRNLQPRGSLVFSDQGLPLTLATSRASLDGDHLLFALAADGLADGVPAGGLLLFGRSLASLVAAGQPSLVDPLEEPAVAIPTSAWAPRLAAIAGLRPEALPATAFQPFGSGVGPLLVRPLLPPAGQVGQP